MKQDHSASIITTPEVLEDTTPRFWGPTAVTFFTIVIFFGAQFIGVLLISLYPALQNWSHEQAEAWISDSVVAQFLTILIIESLAISAVTLLTRRKKWTLTRLGLAWPTLKDLGYALLGLVGYLVIYITLIVIVKQLIPDLNLEQKQQIGFESVREGFDLVLVFISLVILPPVTEEILCRGFLYTGMRTKFPKIIAAIMTSLIFAAAHLQFGSDAPLLWVAAIDTFVLSMVLVGLREKTGKLGAPILLHMLKNGLAFTALFIFSVR